MVNTANAATGQGTDRSVRGVDVLDGGWLRLFGEGGIVMRCTVGVGCWDVGVFACLANPAINQKATMINNDETCWKIVASIERENRQKV
jgi:hypothetical protein